MRLAEDGQSPQPMPNLRKGASPFAGITEIAARSVVEPTITVRRVAGKDVPFADYSGAS